MLDYVIDLTIVSILIIGLTAFMGVIGNTIGNKLFGQKKERICRSFKFSSNRLETNWW